MKEFELINGDCLVEMANLPESFFDSIVTDPPYGLSFMGKDWDHGVPGVHFWKEALRAGAGRTSGARNFHPTVKPVALMRWLCRLVTPPEGIVLDPFMGSGSTGIAANREGFDFVGIDTSAEYVEIARNRLEENARAPNQLELEGGGMPNPAETAPAK